MTTPQAVSTPPTPVEVNGMNARDALELIIERGPAWMEQLRRLHAPSDGIKTVRTFRSTEAAHLVGRSVAWLHENEESSGRIGRAEGVSWRSYTLEDVNALREHAGTRPRREPDDPTQVLAMLNFKGGASKTTTTHLFAHYLAVQGYRVLLIDLDPQGSLTGSFDITNRHGERQEEFNWDDSIGPILTGETDELLPLILRTHWPTIDIVPAAIDSYDAELTIAVQTAREGLSEGDEFWLRVDRALSMVQGYDIVLIDSAPALSFGLINAYMAATGIIVPTPARVVDLQAMQKFAEFLHRWIVKMERAVPSRDKWLRLLISQFSKASVTEQTNSQVSRNYLGSLIMTSPMASSEAIKRGVGGAPSPYEGSTGGVGKSIASANARVRELLDEPFRELLALVEAGWKNSGRAKV